MWRVFRGLEGEFRRDFLTNVVEVISKGNSCRKIASRM